MLCHNCSCLHCCFVCLVHYYCWFYLYCCRGAIDGPASPVLAGPLLRSFMNINYFWNAWEGAGPRVHKLTIASSSSTSASLQTSTLAIDKPHQPLSFPYPKRPFGKTTIVHRSFQSAWYSSWSWLHYNETNDTVLCHLCAGAAARSDMVTPRKDLII